MEAHKQTLEGSITEVAHGFKRGRGIFLEKRSANYPGKVSQDMPEFFPWWKDREFS